MTAPLFPDLVINGETVPQAIIAQEAQNHDAPKDKPGLAWRKAANAIATRTLLLQEARRRRIAADPVEVGPGRFETEEEALIRGLLEQAIDIPDPDEEALRWEWARNPERFRSAPLWEVSHILIACDPRQPEATEAARQRAEALTAKALSNPRGFGRLAEAESDCGSKLSGGALGQLGPGDTVPEFEAVLRTLSEGEITAKPVLSRHGWHIIRMDAAAPTHVLPYETVRPKIAEAWEKAAWSRAAKAFLDQLVDKAEIVGATLKSDTKYARA